MRLREAAHINRSLSALGMVILALADNNHHHHQRDRDRDRDRAGSGSGAGAGGVRRHVPYRDSKLTFLFCASGRPMTVTS